MKMSSLLDLRNLFHQQLIDSGLLTVNLDGIASNADKSQKTSVSIASSIAEELGVVPSPIKMKAQTAGLAFEVAISDFLKRSLAEFSHTVAYQKNIQHVMKRGGKSAYLADFVPYTHLRDLGKAVSSDPTLSTVLGNSYDISPDVVMLRSPEPDSFYNVNGVVRVSDDAALKTPFRLFNNSDDIVEAVISCKWTLRSDRAQNARSEALNIIRNRKGRSPHIVVVTGEPTPSRLASLALGTGDIDMVYHFALPELIKAVDDTGNDEAKSMLDILISGNRLRDIADLALDL